MAIDRTKKQKRNAMKMLAVRLLTSATLGVLIVACFHSYNYLTTTERLAVTEVEFNGLSRVDADEIEKVIADIHGQNILLVPLEEYAARFARHSRIRSAEFRKVLPKKVVCTVTERAPVALVYSNGFLEVDGEGMVMNSDELTDFLDLPIITGVDGTSVREGHLCGDTRLAEALQTLELCKKYGGRFADDISELRVGKRGISVVSLKEGMVLLLGKSKFEQRLKKFFLMRHTIAKTDEAARLVDLRFDDQIVLRTGI